MRFSALYFGGHQPWRASGADTYAALLAAQCDGRA